jgi:hypothetical protein
MVKEYFIYNSNMTSFFRFVNKRESYPFGIISLAHGPVNVTDFSFGSINCNQNNADTQYYSGYINCVRDFPQA